MVIFGGKGDITGSIVGLSDYYTKELKQII